MSDPARTIVFSHANGFPAGTYGVLFDGWCAAGYAVRAVPKFGHDPARPVTSNWPHLREELAGFVTTHATAGPVWLVGHSMGGFLSLMVAATQPKRVRGVVLLDSPLIAGWRAHSLHMVKLSGLVQRAGPGRISARRRREWPDTRSVHEHFASKSIFARWDPRVLDDYVQHGTERVDGLRRLAFDRDIETRIYNGLPHQLPALLKRHPLRCPVAFIGGTKSNEVRQVGLAPTRALTHDRLSWVEGTHLFPFEKPDATVAEVLRWIELMSTGPAAA